MYIQETKNLNIQNGKFTDKSKYIFNIHDHIEDTIQIDKYDGKNSAIEGKIKGFQYCESIGDFGIYVNNTFYYVEKINIGNIQYTRGYIKP